MTLESNLPGLEKWADALVCPACLGALRMEGVRILCVACGRSYPVEDGIPALIVERAEESQHKDES